MVASNINLAHRFCTRNNLCRFSTEQFPQTVQHTQELA